MAGKRKFKVVPLSDDDEENKSSDLGGINTFKKHKQIENDKADERSKITETPKPQEQQPETNQTEPNTNSETPRKTPAAAATNPVGKNFRETFAYLKNPDLFVLPPMPEAKKTIPRNSNCIIVNSRQRGNPILKQIRNIPWEYGDIVPDYEIGKTSCALFLSMRYHSLNPDYIHERLKKLGNMYDLRVMLVLVDVVNCKPSLKELGRVAMYCSCTLILAWSPEEAGRYLETFKSYEHKPPDILQQRVESDHLSKMQDLLTTIKSVNKTDVITLLSTFGSLRSIVNATKQELTDCPGFGSQKATRLYNAFNEPFKRAHSSSQSKQIELSPKKKTKEISSINSADCLLQKPEPDADQRTKKNKKMVSENSENPATKISGTVNAKAEKNIKTLLTNEPGCLSSETSGETSSSSVCNSTNNASNGSADSAKTTMSPSKQAAADRLSKSDAIHQFMKQKTNGAATKQVEKPKSSNPSKKQAAANSKQSTASVTARLRSDLSKRVSAAKLSTPLVNTSLVVVTDTQATPKGEAGATATSTQLTDKEWCDLVADSDDDADIDEF